jgi:tRNA A-37 threonylcarbamoyl transferase component Bud32
MHYLFNPHYDSPALQACLSSPDTLLNAQHTRFLKQDNTTTLGIVFIDHHEIVIKRYNIKNFLHAIKRALTPSRASTCWKYAHALLKAGILTPTPVAMIEKRFGPFRSTAYFLNEFVQGEHLTEYFTNTQHSDEQKKRVAKNIVILLKKLGTLGFVHGDVKPENFILVDEQPVLIDLDSMRMYPRRGWFFQQEHQKDLKRFMKNWVGHPAINQLFEGLE